MRWRSGLIIIGIALGVLLTNWPTGALPLLETVYGETFYPMIQSALRMLPQPRGFALADVLWVLVPVLFLLRLMWLWRANLIRRVPLLILETCLWAVSLYLLMMLLWGLNYQRPTLYSQLKDRGFAVTLADGHWAFALEQTRQTLEQLPEDVDLCALERPYATSRPSAFLHSAMAAADLPPAPTRSVAFSAWSGIYTRLSVGGVYIPFTGEPTVNRNVFNPAKPMIMTHELAHWAGYAHEYDADILAYWSLWMSPDPVWQASAWLLWWSDIRAPEPVQAELPSELTAALTCYRQYLQSQPRWEIQSLMWAVYERNLTNQGVQGGMASYQLGEALALTSYQDWLVRD